MMGEKWVWVKNPIGKNEAEKVRVSGRVFIFHPESTKIE
jgi:hypothetical protein